MANSLITPTIIAKRALMEFKNSMGFSKHVDIQYSEEFHKIGASVNLRKPLLYSVSDGQTLTEQDVTEQSVTLTLDSQKHVGFQFSSKDKSLTVDKFHDRYIKPAITALVNKVDVDGLALAAKNVHNIVGTAGTTPSTFLIYMEAMQKLQESGCPMDEAKSIVLNPAASTKIVDALKALNNPSSKISDQYEKGLMSDAAGAKWFLSQNIYSYTSGQRGGTPLTNGVPAAGATTLVTDGWTAGVANRVKAGDAFTIAAVYAVNPITKVSTGVLQQFVITADASSDGAGNATLSISPAIYATTSLQNVDAAPADNAALTFVQGTSTVTTNNMLYAKPAFALGFADLDVPGGVDMAARASDSDVGISLRVVRSYDIANDKFPCRIDVLYGWKAVRPEFACKIVG